MPYDAFERLADRGFLLAEDLRCACAIGLEAGIARSADCLRASLRRSMISR